MLCISSIWFSFEMLLPFCYFLPTPCSLGLRPMFLSISPVSRWFRPIYLPGIEVFLYATGLLLHSWPRYSMFWRLGIIFLLGGCNRCCVWVRGVFCRIWFRPSGGCVFIFLPFWGFLSTRMAACQIIRCLRLVDRCLCSNGSAVHCICASGSWLGLLSGV